MKILILQNWYDFAFNHDLTQTSSRHICDNHPNIKRFAMIINFSINDTFKEEEDIISRELYFSSGYSINALMVDKSVRLNVMSKEIGSMEIEHFGRNVSGLRSHLLGSDLDLDERTSLARESLENFWRAACMSAKLSRS